jgi:hypothetical protein
VKLVSENPSGRCTASVAVVPWTTVTSKIAVTRRSFSATVTSVFTSSRSRSARTGDAAPASREDQPIRDPPPGATVASTTRRPCARARRVTRARSKVRSDPSPGASIVARIVPAVSSGSCAEARPGSVATAPAHSIRSVKAPAGSTAWNTPCCCRIGTPVAGPEASPGDEPGPEALAGPAAGRGSCTSRARISVPPESSGTAVGPSRRTSPCSVIVPRSSSPSARSARSACETTAAAGGRGTGTAGLAARSTSRLYSARVIVTVFGAATGCARAAGAKNARTTPAHARVTKWMRMITSPPA